MNQKLDVRFWYQIMILSNGLAPTQIKVPNSCDSGQILQDTEYSKKQSEKNEHDAVMASKSACGKQLNHGTNVLDIKCNLFCFLSWKNNRHELLHHANSSHAQSVHILSLALFHCSCYLHMHFNCASKQIYPTCNPHHVFQSAMHMLQKFIR